MELTRGNLINAIGIASVAAVVAVVIVVAEHATSSGSDLGARATVSSSASPGPTSSDSSARQAAAQAVLGSSFTLVSSGPPPNVSGSASASLASAMVEEWKAANGDEANITWQPDNSTLDSQVPEPSSTSTGAKYGINHAPNGSVQIIMFDGTNAVLYTWIDPNVSPSNARNGVLVSDAPSDQALVQQATQLLSAS